jgi:hypothetical protein
MLATDYGLMEGVKAKARCILRLFQGALTQNKVDSDFTLRQHVCDKQRNSGLNV